MPVNTSDIFQTDDNGFSPPNFGGTLGVVAMTVEYTDTVEKVGPELPPNAIPVWMFVSVTEDFDDTSGDTLDIGITGNGDYFADDVDVSTAVNVDSSDTGFVVGRYGVLLEESVNLVATYTEDTGDASQGSANIVLVYFIAGESVTIE